jgi:hypothetical protein
VSQAVAIVGGSPVAAALGELVNGSAQLSLALAVDRTTADHVAQAVGPDGAAVLDLPEGESREFVRSLGARNIKVVDLGPDLRVQQIACGFDESHARGKRLVAMPSAAGMAAWAAAGMLLEKGLLHGDRLAIYAIGGGNGAVGLETATAQVASELGWILDQRGWPMQRRVGVSVRAGGGGMLALVQGELGHEDAQDETLLRKAMAAGPDWAHLCPQGSQPDAARVLGTGIAEVSIAVDWFAEWLLCSCALDPLAFPAHAALRALLAMAT